MNKKGMLGSLVGGFIIILVATQIFGLMSQEIDNMINCNITNTQQNISPIGKTNSFGGGGSGQFGGYDGKIHKSWSSELSIIKTNVSIINKDCKPITGAGITMLGLVPLFFILVCCITGIGIIYNSFKNVGIIKTKGLKKNEYKKSI